MWREAQQIGYYTNLQLKADNEGSLLFYLPQH